MTNLLDILRNETALVSAAIAALTGFLTGPILELDPAAVGSVTGLLVIALNLWVRTQVYSRRTVTEKVTEAATVAAADMATVLDERTAGAAGQVTDTGEAIATTVAEDVAARVLAA